MTSSGNWQLEYFDAAGQSAISGAMNWREMRIVYDTSYSVTGISGGPTDSIWYIGNVELYGGRRDRDPFSMAFGSQWTQSSSSFLDFELSIVGFGPTPMTPKLLVPAN